MGQAVEEAPVHVSTLHWLINSYTVCPCIQDLVADNLFVDSSNNWQVDPDPNGFIPGV